MGDDGCCSAMITAPRLVIFIVFVSTITRIYYILCQCRKPVYKAQQPLRTLIVLGSGGHTTEMLNLISILQKDRFTPRIYIAASTDNMSLQKARVLESSLANQGDTEKAMDAAKYMQIYRSREVGQSYLTSVGTTLIAMIHALWLVIKIRPQVILCNGPGTCIPLCIIAFFFKLNTKSFTVIPLNSVLYFLQSQTSNFLAVINWTLVIGIRWSSIFYIESIARVKRLSLSGLLLYKLQVADQIFVQWSQLQKKYPRTRYVGCLM